MQSIAIIITTITNSLLYSLRIQLTYLRHYTGQLMTRNTWISRLIFTITLSYMSISQRSMNRLDRQEDRPDTYCIQMPSSFV